MQKKVEILTLVVILFLSFVVRLYRIDEPLADWHSWRQADTAAVARNYVKYGVDLLHPIYDDISSTQSGLDNPNGYRMVEFPIYNALVASVYSRWPGYKMETWARMISILASLGSLIFLYLIVKKYKDSITALFTGFFFGLIPYNIFFSRTILPEPTMTFAFLGAIYFFDKYLDEESKSKKTFWFACSAILSSIALLVKVMAVFFLFPIIYLILSKYKLKVLIKPELWIYALVTFIPIILWRVWITKFPEGIPASDWLLNGGNIRFKGAFFRWIIAERMGKLILAYGGFVLFFFGLVAKKTKSHMFLLSFLVSSITYVIVFARGNVQHDYYQIPTIPSLAIFAAIGARELLEKSKILLLSLILMMLGFGWYEIRGDFNINHPEIVEAGIIVDRITPPDALVIAPYEGDTAFLYQTKRKGWPIGGEIEDKIKKGANYYVSNTYNEETNSLMNKYKVVAKNDKFVVIKLN